MPEKPEKNGVTKEFQEFMSVPGETPPRKLSERVRTEIANRLYPSLALVLAKVTLIYAVTGILVLLVCPQFGLTLAADHGILHI
ncbi:MAG: hypothetical protein KDD39_15340, partial [Bdellovibrionales bacterium]|nr:hypothetical protein [Bdellovibrionales bacterium]